MELIPPCGCRLCTEGEETHGEGVGVEGREEEAEGGGDQGDRGTVNGNE